MREIFAATTPTDPVADRQAHLGHSTLCRLLRNKAYIGRVYYSRPSRCPTSAPPTAIGRSRATATMIPVDCPRIISDELFAAAGRVATDNTDRPRRAEPGQ